MGFIYPLLLLLILTSSCHSYFEFLKEEFRHIRDVSTSEKPPCDDDKFIEYLSGIQIANPENIFDIAFTEADDLCRQLSDVIKGSDKYLKTCEVKQNLYVSLINGVRILDTKICKPSKFLEKYETFYPCLHELSGDFESCNGPADWNEDYDTEKICNTYKDISDCYYVKAAKVCGKDAAKCVKELLLSVVNEVLTVKCSSVWSDPEVKQPMPAAYLKVSGATSRFSHRWSFLGVFLGVLVVCGVK